MPLEILGEIFIHAMEGSKQSMLARICRVSKNWREAAHLVPRLWTNTTIGPSVPSLAYDSVSSWVRRSCGSPRTLVVKSEQCAGRDVNGKHQCQGVTQCYFLNPMLGELLRKTPNVERVSLECPTSYA
jgi:hypothetical protein